MKKNNLKKTFSLVFLMVMVSISSILIYRSLSEAKTIKAAGGPNADTLDLFDWTTGISYPSSGYGIKEYIDYKAANRPVPAGSIGAIAQITFTVLPQKNSIYYPDVATCQTAAAQHVAGSAGNSYAIGAVYPDPPYPIVLKQKYDPNNITTLMPASGTVYQATCTQPGSCDENGCGACTAFSCDPVSTSTYVKYGPWISCGSGYTPTLMSYSRVDNLGGISYGWTCNTPGNETEVSAGINSFAICATWYCQKQ